MKGKGYVWPVAHVDPPANPPEHFEQLAADAVGSVMEFWGFKRNQGRVWALLYVRDEALTAAQIERELGLSKGGVSMLLRDLERWGVVHRVRLPRASAWRFRAETRFLRMLRNVVQEREFRLVSQVRSDLREAIAAAKRAQGTNPAQLRRLETMDRLADNIERGLQLFLQTARLDLGRMFASITSAGTTEQG